MLSTKHLNLLYLCQILALSSCYRSNIWNRSLNLIVVFLRTVTEDSAVILCDNRHIIHEAVLNLVFTGEFEPWPLTTDPN